MEFHFGTFLWTLLNLSLVVLLIVGIVYGILALRKYVTVDTTSSKHKTPEDG